MGNAKLRKSWNKSGEVPVVQGLRGVANDYVLVTTSSAGVEALSS
jgi:hypothetical protein